MLTSKHPYANAVFPVSAEGVSLVTGSITHQKSAYVLQVCLNTQQILCALHQD